MSQGRRVDAQPAYVLHAHPFRETSLILEVFSRDHGRVALVARGARRPRSSLRGVLMAFQPLELGWAGKGEVQTLMKAEWQGGQALLVGRGLYCGYYLNELLLHLLPREDAHERLYAAYRLALQSIVDPQPAGGLEVILRRFEHALLAELGYGLSLSHDTDGQAIDPEARYCYQIEQGPCRVDRQAPAITPQGPCSSGQTLLDIRDDRYASPRAQAEAKQLMRALIAHYLDGRELETRKIFRGL